MLIGIGEVARRTGVGVSTLRAWETRYHLPVPRRTEGGHRLYAADDVETIRWVAARTREGMQAGDAMRLARARGDRRASEVGVAFTGAVVAPIEAMRDAWIAACLRLDEAAAEAVTSVAVETLGAATAFEGVLQAGVRKIGELWAQRAATPHQEHFASALATRRLTTLVAELPPPTRPGWVLCGCAGGDEHGLTALLVVWALRLAGFRVTDLSANVPVAGLAELVRRQRPDLVVLSAQSTAGLKGLVLSAASLLPTGIPLGYGGGICNRAPAARAALPAIFLGESIPAAVTAAEDLLAGWRRPTPAQPVLDPGLPAFQRERPLLEAMVGRALEESAPPSPVDAVETLGDLIEVALLLGRPDVVPDDATALAALVDPLLPATRLVALADAYGRALHSSPVSARLRRVAGEAPAID